MKKQHNQPKNEREQAGRQGNEHQPAHHAERIKQVAVIFPIDQAGMHRAFIHSAAVRVSDYSARYH